MRGARTDAFRLTWAHVFMLDVGESASTVEIHRSVSSKSPEASPRAVLQALRLAGLGAIVVREPPPVDRRAIVWRRLSMPTDRGKPIDTAWLQRGGLPPQHALNLLLALSSAKLLELGPNGYVVRP